MKKVLLCGLIGFILIGCGDNKVTKEYLVGNWNCIYSKYEKNDDSTLEENDDYYLESSKKIKHTYKIVDGVLMAKWHYGKPVEFDLDELYKNPTTEDYLFGCKYITNHSLIKNSGDKFTWEMKELVICSDKSGEDVIMSQTKKQRVCTRIK